MAETLGEPFLAKNLVSLETGPLFTKRKEGKVQSKKKRIPASWDSVKKTATESTPSGSIKFYGNLLSNFYSSSFFEFFENLPRKKVIIVSSLPSLSWVS